MREGQKTATARRLRRDKTDSERLLWRALRMRHLGGFKFRRQHPVGPYVVDFACLAARLVIEVDGGQHAGLASDVGRDAYLCRNGYRVLRFWNNDLLANIEGVCDVILHRLTGSPPPSRPSRTSGGRRRRRPFENGHAPSPSPACGRGLG